MIPIKKTFALVLALIALAAPSTVFAQSGLSGYENEGSSIQGTVDEGGGGGGSSDGATATASRSGGSGSGGSGNGEDLPFTGADLGVLAAAGSMLALLGFGLRRMTHRPSEA